MIKKLFKVIGVLLLLGIIAFGVIYAVYNEKLPEGEAGIKADALAQKMLETLNYEQYKKTRFLEWSFRGGAYEYKWDKVNAIVEVKWDNYLVNIDLISKKSSQSFKNGERLKGKENEKIVSKAIASFNNDSFWLVAPYKVFDQGTERKIVSLEDGLNGLLVTYNSGGSTPGDSYLWILQPNGFPKSFKMWVSILPIGGVETTWDDWAVMESGAYLPKSHKLGPINLSLGDVKGYDQ